MKQLKIERKGSAYLVSKGRETPGTIHAVNKGRNWAFQRTDKTRELLLSEWGQIDKFMAELDRGR